MLAHGVVATLGMATLAQQLLARVQANNAAGPAAAAARSFIVGGSCVGAVLPQCADALAQFKLFAVDDASVRLLDLPEWAADDLLAHRSAAVGEALSELRAADAVPMLRGWRDETLAIRTSFYAPAALLVERASAPLFGAAAYGVFLNGYVCEDGGGGGGGGAVPEALWLGTRSLTKPTWPGLLDCLAAGGLAAGELPRSAMVKEGAEEAGLPAALAARVRPTGAVSYTGFNDDGWGLKRDVLFTFDLPLPADLTPSCVDGEMASFTLTPVAELLSLLASPEPRFKPNVGVVCIDFALRHGLVSPDDAGFLELVDALRGAECR